MRTAHGSIAREAALEAVDVASSSRRTPRGRSARRSSPTAARSRRRSPSRRRRRRSRRRPAGSCASGRARRRPPRASARARSPGRSDCQSWFPSTATTGISRSRQASATTHTSSTWPCWVRSPASRIEVGLLLDRAGTPRAPGRASAEPAWMSPAAATRIVFAMRRSRTPDCIGHARVPNPSDAERRDLQRDPRRDEARAPRRYATTTSPSRSPAASPSTRAAAPRPSTTSTSSSTPRGRRRALEHRSATRDSAPNGRPRAGSTRSTRERRADRPDLRAEQQARGRPGDARPGDERRGVRDHPCR